MNVHLIRDSGVSKSLYQEVYELLSNFRGPLVFLTNEDFMEFKDIELSNEQTFNDEDEFSTKEDFPDLESSSYLNSTLYDPAEFPIKRKIVAPEEILDKCKVYRQQNDIGENEIVILLTEQANSLNWFSFGDKYRNAFIHTRDWGFYLDCNRSFPVAYEVVSNILQLLLFKSIEDLEKHIHIEESRGCMNDFCRNKKDIIFKMKTADICLDCQDLLVERSFPINILNQIIDTIEVLRKKLISIERFSSKLSPGRVVFRGRLRKMILVDAGYYELKLTPLEKTVYHLFIENSEGIKAHDIYSKREEIEALYGHFFNGTNIAQFQNSIDNLCDYLNGSMQEKISRINNKLKKALGDSLAESYLIKKDAVDERYKIELNRELISYKD